MLKSVVIGTLSGAILFAVAASAADQAAKPTDPQIAHIAYTAGKIDIEAATLFQAHQRHAEQLASHLQLASELQ
ncbi:MAG TPA: hypothetical protein VNO69_09710 [Methyloceanibacter sp.]|nr:hypothetical protein [Methyloceanibacter sp.]